MIEWSSLSQLIRDKIAAKAPEAATVGVDVARSFKAWMRQYVDPPAPPQQEEWDPKAGTGAPMPPGTAAEAAAAQQAQDGQGGAPAPDAPQQG